MVRVNLFKAQQKWSTSCGCHNRTRWHCLKCSMEICRHISSHLKHFIKINLPVATWLEKASENREYEGKKLMEIESLLHIYNENKRWRCYIHRIGAEYIWYRKLFTQTMYRITKRATATTASGAPDAFHTNMMRKQRVCVFVYDMAKSSKFEWHYRTMAKLWWW